jgi:flagellar M-ring protein FliF
MLRTQIRRSEKIEDCLVLINPAVVSAFMRPEEEQPASASIMLTTKNGEMLTTVEARAIASLVVNAVSGLTLENVSVVDGALNVYLLTEDPEGDETTNLTTQHLLELSMKHELASQVVNLLTPAFGQGKVRAEVSVALDFDSVRSEAIEFAPPVPGEDEGLIISMSELYETARGIGAAGGVPGTDNNGMGATEEIDGTIEYPYGDLGDEETYRKILRETNLEINKTTTQIERAKGGIKALSIAVMLDSLSIPEDYTESVRNLVAGAIGTSADYIAVERLPFQEPASNPIIDAANSQAEALNKYKSQELVQTGIICGFALLCVILILALVRSLLRKPKPQEVLAMAGEGGHDYIVGDDEDIDGIYEGEDMPSVGEQDETVAVGAPPLETVVQLEKMIKSNPEAVATILRNWLAEDNPI